MVHAVKSLVLVAAVSIRVVDAHWSTTEDVSMCDESKCRMLNPASAPGYWWLPAPQEDYEAYTCWSPISSEDSEADRYPCAEGYEGRRVSKTATSTKTDEETGIEYEWYTCCPLNYTGIAEQTCVDTDCDPSTASCWAVPDGLAPRRCITDKGFPYAKDTGAFIPYDHGDMVYNVSQFLCCQNDEANSRDDELDRNGDLLPDACSTTACTSLDGVMGPGDCWADGVTEPFGCDTKSKFPYPSRNGHDDLNMFNFHYVCCSTPNYYTEDMGADEWDGLHVALVIQSVIAFVSFVLCSVFTLGILFSTATRSHAWNVYLVLLSVPDVIYNLFRFAYGIVVVTRHSTFVSTTWSIDWFYAVANLLLNGVIVFEVNKFLRAFKQMRRIPPPSFRRVVIQASVVYVLAASCGIWMYFLHVNGNTIAGGSHDRFLQIHKISLCVMVIPPIIFVTLIYLDVWWHQLLPHHDGRTRTLALYFLRVIFVFMATWLPYMILMTFGLRSSRTLGYIGLALSSLQGSLSVLMAMTKQDVQWAVISFLRCKCNEVAPTTPKMRSRTSGMVRISGVGFSSGNGISSVDEGRSEFMRRGESSINEKSVRFELNPEQSEALSTASRSMRAESETGVESSERSGDDPEGQGESSSPSPEEEKSLSKDAPTPEPPSIEEAEPSPSPETIQDANEKATTEEEPPTTTNEEVQRTATIGMVDMTGAIRESPRVGGTKRFENTELLLESADSLDV